jgi:hypothetical protein
MIYFFININLKYIYKKWKLLFAIIFYKNVELKSVIKTMYLFKLKSE